MASATVDIILDDRNSAPRKIATRFIALFSKQKAMDFYMKQVYRRPDPTMKGYSTWQRVNK